MTSQPVKNAWKQVPKKAFYQSITLYSALLYALFFISTTAIITISGSLTTTSWSDTLTAILVISLVNLLIECFVIWYALRKNAERLLLWNNRLQLNYTLGIALIVLGIDLVVGSLAAKTFSWPDFGILFFVPPIVATLFVKNPAPPEEVRQLDINFHREEQS